MKCFQPITLLCNLSSLCIRLLNLIFTYHSSQYRLINFSVIWKIFKILRQFFQLLPGFCFHLQFFHAFADRPVISKLSTCVCRCPCQQIDPADMPIHSVCIPIILIALCQSKLGDRKIHPLDIVFCCILFTCFVCIFAHLCFPNPTIFLCQITGSQYQNLFVFRSLLRQNLIY